MRKTWSVFILLWLVAVAGETDAQSRPQWLYQPPQISGYIFGVGISPLYREDSLSFQNARLNAIEELTKQYQVRIVSKRAERELASRSLSYQYTIETIDSLHYRQCFGNAVTLDSVISSQYAYILLGVADDLSCPSLSDIPVNSYRSDVTQRVAPVWVNNPPNKPGVLFGVGVSQPYRQEDDAWSNSVTQARRDIAFTIMANRSYLQNDSSSNRGSYYSKWSETETEIVLTRNYIRARWYDSQNNLYYTLVELRQN